MSQYYYLVAGLPDLSLGDSKLSYTVADFRTELYPFLTDADKKLIDLFYLKFDNANVLSLLKDKEASVDTRGNYSASELLENIAILKEGGTIADKHFPSYLSTFIIEYFTSAGSTGILPEDRLAALYYAYGMQSSNRFVASWFEFQLNMKNILIVFTARKHKLEAASLIVGDTETTDALRTSNARDFGLGGEIGYLEQLLKISDTENLLEREKKTDALHWKWIEDETFFNNFSIERLFVFLLQLEIIERWLSLDKEKGNQLFRSIISSLKDSARIPVEFR